MVVSVRLILLIKNTDYKYSKNIFKKSSSGGGSSFGGIKSHQITPNKGPENGGERWHVAHTPLALRVNMVKIQEICPGNFQHYAETT